MMGSQKKVAHYIYTPAEFCRIMPCTPTSCCRMHAGKAACPEVPVKDSVEGRGSDESRAGVSPVTAGLSTPSAVPGKRRAPTMQCLCLI